MHLQAGSTLCSHNVQYWEHVQNKTEFLSRINNVLLNPSYLVRKQRIQEDKEYNGVKQFSVKNTLSMTSFWRYAPDCGAHDESD